MEYLKRQGAVAIGQSSWGPTGFCAVQGLKLAEKLRLQAEQQFAHYENITVRLASARNSGGEVLA